MIQWTPNFIQRFDENPCWPYTAYIIPDELYPVTKGEGIPCPHKIKPYAPGKNKGGKIAIFRAGAFGDLILSTGIIKYLLDHEPGAIIDVYCSFPKQDLFEGLGSRQLAYPPSMEAWDSYDCHVPLDDLFAGKLGGIECGTGPGNHFDRIFAWMGVDPDPKYKRPWLTVVEKDFTELKEKNIWPLPKPYFVYNVSSSGPNRTYPPQMGKEAVAALLDELPGHVAVILGQNEHMPFHLKHDRVINLYNKTKVFRSMFPIVQDADFVIGPDSAGIHIAGGLSRPSISLWGPYDPEWRVKYYTDSYPVFVPGVCPHAPCAPHPDMPQVKCKDATNRTKGMQRWCNVMRAITKEMIVEKARIIMRSKQV